MYFFQKAPLMVLMDSLKLSDQSTTQVLYTSTICLKYIKGVFRFFVFFIFQSHSVCSMFMPRKITMQGLSLHESSTIFVF